VEPEGDDARAEQAGLTRAIQGKGAFRQFKDRLPEEQRPVVVLRGEHPPLVAGVNGGELLVHRLDVAAMLGYRGRDRLPVRLVTVLVQEPDRRIQGGGSGPARYPEG
jgi:hypothetical protein